MIRHAGLAAPVLALTVAVIEPAFGASLVAPVGAPPLLPVSLLAAGGTAIAMATVAV